LRNAGDIVDAAGAVTGSLKSLHLVFFLGLPAVVLFWLMRTLSRKTNDHEALANDAGTRVAMVQTLSALQGEGAAGDGEKGLRPEESLLVLGALFRPPAVLQDDGMPPSVLGEILKGVAGKKG
jgi:hypothetical protein